MKALRYLGPGRLQVEDMPVPTISSGEVLVAIAACGLCATDVKTYRRGHPRISPGAVLGHEMAGTIVALGAEMPLEDREGNAWRVGDRVAIPPYVACGHCHVCRSKRATLCPQLTEVGPDPGGFAELVRVPARIVSEGLARLANHVPFPLGALVEPIACVVHGFDALDLHQGGSLLVLGDGPMGQLHVEVGRARGCSPIILVGATDNRLAFAQERADVVLDARGHDVVDRVRQVVGGGVTGVAVCVDIPEAVETGVALAMPGGRVNVFAGMPPGQSAQIDLRRIHYDEVHLLGTFGSGPADFSRAADLVAVRHADLSRFITSRVPLASVVEAFERTGDYQGMKTVVVFDRDGPSS
jgi:L-iditol 2-dehydrogenase